MKVIAETIGIDIRTVGLTRIDWLKRGFESLVDAPRTGAPKKITAEQLEKLLDAAEKEPLTVKALNRGRDTHYSGVRQPNAPSHPNP